MFWMLFEKRVEAEGWIVEGEDQALDDIDPLEQALGTTTQCSGRNVAGQQRLVDRFRCQFG